MVNRETIYRVSPFARNTKLCLAVQIQSFSLLVIIYVILTKRGDLVASFNKGFCAFAIKEIPSLNPKISLGNPNTR